MKSSQRIGTTAHSSCFQKWERRDENGIFHQSTPTSYTTKELGITPHVCLDHGMTLSFYYVDPDGNGVELQVDNFGDWAQSRAWMRTSPDFAANPIGQFVDPEQLVAIRKAGASHTDIHRRAYAGEFPPSSPMDPRIPLDDPRAPV